MIAVRRLTAVGAVLGLTVAITSSQVWGDPKRGQELEKWRSSSASQHPSDRRFADELAASRFAEQSFVVYRDSKEQTYFALQLQPKLDAAAARPRDYAVLVDISASKAQGPLAMAQQMTEALAARLGPDDRLAIWTVGNDPRSLTKGFKLAKDLTGALKELAQEYPSGAANLKKGIADATAAFDGQANRHRIIVLLGDGKSLAGPLDNDDRAALSDEMVKREVAFYSVPLGERLEPLNLHGLASATGGRCVRIRPSEKCDEFLTRLDAIFAAPVLYPHTFQLPAEATEVFPTRLPPLRSDAPTLVVGKLKDGAKQLTYRVGGQVAGRETTFNAAPAVPAAEVENFFLVGMVNQWREQKDRPALMQADRALAYAAERNQMARAELVAKAEMALDQDKFAAAEKLYKQAGQVDPTSLDAQSGVKIARRMQDILEKIQDEQSKSPAGKKQTGEQIREEVRKRFRADTKIEPENDEIVRIVRGAAVRIAQAEPTPKPAPPAPPLAPADAPDPLKDVKARIAVAEQQQGQIAEDAVRQANRLVETDPNGARELLKRTLEGVRNNPDIGDRARAALGNRIERSLASIDRRGVVVLRDQKDALETAARAAARLGAYELEQNAENRIRERMRVFHNLMNQARELEAFRQGLAIRRDLLAQGQQVPSAVTASIQMGLNGYHLREIKELKRLREEMFMATMLQVEKSAVPFPDEPPVVFPPAAEWKALADLRKVKYESSTLGAAVPQKTLELRDTLGRAVKFQGFDDPKTTLTEALDQLAQRYDVQFDVNEKAFKFENVMDVLKTEIASPNAIPPLNASLGTILRKLLSKIVVGSGATYIIRRDTIEITTGQFATAEKALRVYPVGDLVTPIPNAVNQQVVNQAATLFGFAGAVGVQIGVQLGGVQLGGFGGVQLGGVQLGGFGGVQLGGVQLGGFGGVQLGGIQLGGFGGVQLGVQLGGIQIGGNIGGNQLGVQQGGFQGNFQGAANLGVGGGAAGIGGGQLGQFGNLGGQFGLQGGDQSRLLITTIRQVVGTPKDWAPAFDPITGKPLNQLDEGDPAITGGENNQLGYYPPALALVVKGTSRIHTRTVGPITVTGGDKLGAADKPGGDALVRIGGKDGRDPKAAPDAVVAAPKKGVPDGPVADPRKVWQDALAKGVNDPGLIIAVADYLAMNRKFDHAAEFLKAVLRQGIVVKPWVYQSLAIALRESGGSPEEIERAETAALDLEPQDAQGYLKASRAMAKDKRFDRAVAFCRQASLLEPDVPYPYAEALLYAELAKDSKAMEWAAGNLVKQDWPVQNQELQAKAMQKVDALLKELDRGQRPAEALRLQEAVRGQKLRDLVIKMTYQGDADLDLKVQEPTGSVCSALNRQTVGGGILVGDSLADLTSETYAAATAFPGEYAISVERIRGRSLGDRAQIKIVQHQGTPEETEQLVTIDLLSPMPVKFQLAKGRRTEAAYVPPPAAMQPEKVAAVEAVNPNHILTELRAAADPEVTGVERGFRGQTSSPTAVAVDDRPASKAAEISPNDRAFYQTKVSSFVKNSLDVTAQAVLSADRRHMRVSLAAVVAPNAGGSDRPVQVVDPLIPGGGN